MDTTGRLNLKEMRNEVRRRCDLLRYNVIGITIPEDLAPPGSEAELQQIDRLVSDNDINMYLNMALARRCVDVNISDSTIMADEAAIDAVANQVEYVLPFDLMFLRAVYWKPTNITYTAIPPNQRYMLYELDSDGDIGIQSAGDQVQTYRRRLNLIVLNEVPQSNNPRGLIIDYVKNMRPLLVDDQILETPLATILQQVIIQDAIVEVTAQKLKLETTELRQTQAELVAQLTMAVLNYHIPKIIRMTPGITLAFPPFARRPNSWRGWGFGSRGWL